MSGNTGVPCDFGGSGASKKEVDNDVDDRLLKSIHVGGGCWPTMEPSWI